MRCLLDIACPTSERSKPMRSQVVLGIGLGLLILVLLGGIVGMIWYLNQPLPPIQSSVITPTPTAMPTAMATPTAMPTPKATTIVMVVPTDAWVVSTPDFWGTLVAMQTQLATCCPVCSWSTSTPTRTPPSWSTSTPTRTPRPWRPSPTPTCVICNQATPTLPVIPTNTPCVTCNQATPTPPVINTPSPQPTATECPTCNLATPTPP